MVEKIPFLSWFYLRKQPSKWHSIIFSYKLQLLVCLIQILHAVGFLGRWIYTWQSQLVAKCDVDVVFIWSREEVKKRMKRMKGVVLIIHLTTVQSSEHSSLTWNLRPLKCLPCEAVLLALVLILLRKTNSVKCGVIASQMPGEQVWLMWSLTNPTHWVRTLLQQGPCSTSATSSDSRPAFRTRSILLCKNKLSPHCSFSGEKTKA